MPAVSSNIIILLLTWKRDYIGLFIRIVNLSIFIQNYGRMLQEFVLLDELIVFWKSKKAKRVKRYQLKTHDI